MKKILVILLSMILACLLFGCAASLPKLQRPQFSAIAPETEKTFAAELPAFGSRITSYKALGKVVLKKNGVVLMTSRAAWIAEYPDKLSLVALGAGIPLMRLACDGKKIYYADSYNNSAGDFYTADNTAYTMNRFLNIYISTQELVSLWLGRVDTQGYTIAGVWENHPEVVVTMQNNNGFRDVYFERTPITTTAWFTESKLTLLLVNDFRKNGGLEYEAVFEDYRNINGTKVPFFVSINNHTDTQIEFTAERVWLNEPTELSMFRITPEQ